MPSSMALKKGHISVFWVPVSTLFSTVLAASSFIRIKNGNVGYFLYCFQRHHRGFKGKVDLSKKLAQKVHLSFNFIYSYMNCRKCVIKSCSWHCFLARFIIDFFNMHRLDYYLLSYLKL